MRKRNGQWVLWGAISVFFAFVLVLTGIHRAVRKAASAEFTTGALEIEYITMPDSYTACIEWTDTGADYYELYRRNESDTMFNLITKTESFGWSDIRKDKHTSDTVYMVKSFRNVDGEIIECDTSEVKNIGFEQRNTSGFICMMYHVFFTDEDIARGVYTDAGSITIDAFESDLQWLRQNGYETITIKELTDYWAGQGTLPEKGIMLTFDDAHLGVYEYVWPLMEKYNYKGIISVIGDLAEEATEAVAENRRGPMDYTTYMTWDELAEIAASGCFEISSHTFSLHQMDGVNHRYGVTRLENEPLEEWKKIMFHDADRINEKIMSITGSRPLCFAYPFNRPCAESNGLFLDELGYQVLLMGDGTVVKNSMMNWYVDGGDINWVNRGIKRFSRHPDTSIAELLDKAIANDLPGM